MNTYNGNALHINTNEKNDELQFSNWSDVKRAQTILKGNTEKYSKEQYLKLVNDIYKSIIKSNFTGSGFVVNANKAIFDWNIEVSESSLISMRRWSNMLKYAESNNLDNWQKDFIKAIESNINTRQVLIFKTNNTNYFWIVAKDASAQSIFEYSKSYTCILEKYNDIDFDFLVLDQDEVEDYCIPNECIKISFEG